MLQTKLFSDKNKHKFVIKKTHQTHYEKSLLILEGFTIGPIIVR